LIRTPSLEEQLRDAPGELARLVRFLAKRAVGETESKPLARECERWIAENLGGDYTWPGNVRELDQCVRNIMVRGSYRPRELSTDTDDLAASLSKGELTLEELTRRYVTQVYSETGSYLATARRLGIDRRTVKARIDHETFGELASSANSVVRKSR
jgi:DNA-binding NtrC family response regulator